MKKKIATVDENGVIEIIDKEGFHGEVCAGELEKLLRLLEEEGIEVKTKTVKRVVCTSSQAAARQGVSA